jgi:hypothetical protein
MKEENITNEELLAVLNEGFRDVRMDIKQLQEGQRDMRMDIEGLKEGAFTKDEKEGVLDMVKNIDKRLEEETLGKDKITLNRDEYNGVSNTVGFENKFEKVS